MACAQILRVDIGGCDLVPALNVVPTSVFISHPNSHTENGHRYVGLLAQRRKRKKIKQHSRYDKEQTKAAKRRCQSNTELLAPLGS
jgi:hypothetical protein